MKTLLAVLAPLFLAVSCANYTPQGRIENNPGMYARLSSRDKELVRHGTIGRGMTTDAVYLAWGNPDSRFDGMKGGQFQQRWVYTSSEPVYTTNFFAGSGYGRYGRYGYRSSGFGFGPEISYVPTPSAAVTFINSRVDSFERRR